MAGPPRGPGLVDAGAKRAGGGRAAAAGAAADPHLAAAAGAAGDHLGAAGPGAVRGPLRERSGAHPAPWRAASPGGLVRRVGRRRLPLRSVAHAGEAAGCDPLRPRRRGLLGGHRPRPHQRHPGADAGRHRGLVAARPRRSGALRRQQLDPARDPWLVTLRPRARRPPALRRGPGRERRPWRRCAGPHRGGAPGALRPRRRDAGTPRRAGSRSRAARGGGGPRGQSRRLGDLPAGELAAGNRHGALVSAVVGGRAGPRQGAARGGHRARLADGRPRPRDLSHLLLAPRPRLPPGR